MKKLVPYSVYLPIEHYEKIKVLASQRKASAMVRDAIGMILDGDDTYKAGYNKALRDCVKQVNNVKEIENIAVQGKYLSTLLSENIESLEM
jgi:bisphosphoglycerate-independent phosphoglycerate mutase (AlkP superfamily)